MHKNLATILARERFAPQRGRRGLREEEGPPLTMRHTASTATGFEPRVAATPGVVRPSRLGREDVCRGESQHFVVRIDGLASAGDVADIVG
jgi:hypothetical protein